MLGCTSCGSGDSFSVHTGGSGLRHREGLEPSGRHLQHPTLACPHLQLFVVGGFDGLRRLRSVERYDPFSNSWASAAPLPEAVSSAAVVSCEGRIYVIGGAGQDGVSTNKVGMNRVPEACCVLGAALALSCPCLFSHSQQP